MDTTTCEGPAACSTGQTLEELSVPPKKFTVACVTAGAMGSAEIVHTLQLLLLD